MLCYSLFARSAQPSQAPGWRGEPPPSIWEGGSRGTEGALPLCLLGNKKPTPRGVGLFSKSGRQVIDDDDIDPVSRSRRSVGHTGGGYYVPTVAACLMSLSGAQSNYPAARRVSSFGTPSRPVIAHRGISWLDIQSRKNAPSNGVYCGG